MKGIRKEGSEVKERRTDRRTDGSKGKEERKEGHLEKGSKGKEGRMQKRTEGRKDH